MYACAYTRAAHEAGAWAKLSDLVRLQVVYEHGGIYLDTDSRVAARQLDIVASKPGFKAAVYASDTIPNRIQQWKKVSRTVTVKREQAIQLDTARRPFRYYLLWISELPDGGQAAIKELSLKK